MFIDREELKDYPFKGVFYKSEVDKSLPPSQQVHKEVIICEVQCDIQQYSDARVGTNVRAEYSVYVPFDSDTEEIPVQRGNMFRGHQYGLLVAGRVNGVFPSQLGTFQNYSENLSDGKEHRCRGYLAIVEATDV